MRVRVTFLHQLWCSLTPQAVRPAPDMPLAIVGRVQNGVVEHFPTAA